jgi:hypothetical protein
MLKFKLETSQRQKFPGPVEEYAKITVKPYCVITPERRLWIAFLPFYLSALRFAYPGISGMFKIPYSPVVDFFLPR